MLTQPVLVARLSTHAWALGKGPALFSLRHRDREKPWKSWVLPQECVRMCACVRALFGVSASTFKRADMGDSWNASGGEYAVFA